MRKHAWQKCWLSGSATESRASARSRMSDSYRWRFRCGACVLGPGSGMMTWGDLFTARQKVALSALVAVVKQVEALSSPAISAVLKDLFALVIDRITDKCAAIVYWHDRGNLLTSVCPAGISCTVEYGRGVATRGRWS